MTNRMNLGCGLTRPPDWVNVDVTLEWGECWLWNPAVQEAPPWLGPRFDVVVANHVLMMVPHHQLDAWLTNVRGALRPGGVLRLVQADIVGALRAAADNNAAWFPPLSEETVHGKLCQYLTQGGATRSVFTPQWTIELLERNGFTDVTEAEYGHSPLGWQWEAEALDSRPGESFIVEGRA